MPIKRSDIASTPGCFGEYLTGNITAERDCDVCIVLQNCMGISGGKSESSAKKLDEGKAKLSLIHPSMFCMILSKDGDGWQYTACCHIIKVGHAETIEELNDRIRTAIWYIRDKLGSWKTLELTSSAMAYGIKKYGRNNWKKGMAWSRLVDAALRHFVAAALGEEIDEESGLPHEALGLASLHMLLGNVELEIGENDLFKE